MNPLGKDLGPQQPEQDISRHRVTPERVAHEQIFESAPTFLSLPKNQIATTAAGATTISVKNIEHLILSNTAPVTVTDFLEGQEGQRLYLLGDGQTTLLHGTKIILQGGVNLLLAAGVGYMLVKLNKLWRQI